ncbi:bacteriohemerythrin [Shumkonia mesophila]|uniref:bacteriohemerythrin n=1 Tax=Shumkonia mesophila TaxID=2838854 RepID=UPI0029344A59|nr:hemerythrin family protein [Shumkonia mesophila]
MPKLPSLPSRPSPVLRRPAHTSGSRRRDVLAEINTANECLLFLVSAMFGANRPCQRTGGSCSKIGDLLTFLRRRFAEEERMMDDAGYRPAGLHRAEHRAILARLETMHSTLECGKYDPDAVLAFLESWVIDHIETHDKPLGQYFAADMDDGIPAPRAPRRDSHVVAH